MASLLSKIQFTGDNDIEMQEYLGVTAFKDEDGNKWVVPVEKGFAFLGVGDWVAKEVVIVPYRKEPE